MKSLSEIYNILFTGNDRYMIGLLFIFANIANYFINMRKLKLNDNYSIFILLLLILCARIIA